MRIWNCKDYEWASLALIPWFVPANQEPLNMAWELHERLRENPDDTLCLVAIEKNIIQAVLIAYKKKRIIWLWQAHARQGFKFSKLMFNGLVSWAKGKKISRIKCSVSDEKNRRLYELKYGFKSKRNKELYLNVA